MTEQFLSVSQRVIEISRRGGHSTGVKYLWGFVGLMVQVSASEC